MDSQLLELDGYIRALSSTIKHPNDVERRMEQLRLFTSLSLSYLCDSLLSLSLTEEKLDPKALLRSISNTRHIILDTLSTLTNIDSLLLSSGEIEEVPHDLPPFEGEEMGKEV